MRRFPQAIVDHVSTVEGLHVHCVFPRSDRFAATVTLTVGLLHDRERGVVSAFQSVDVVPMLVPFDRGGHLDLAIQGAERGESDERAVAFLDDALLGFLRHFLSLETDPQYQRASTTVDPVCRMVVNAASAAASVEHARTCLYFCSTGCRDKFVEDPESYLRPRVQLRS